jgi:hypothetical protein
VKLVAFTPPKKASADFVLLEVCGFSPRTAKVPLVAQSSRALDPRFKRLVFGTDKLQVDANFDCHLRL